MKITCALFLILIWLFILDKVCVWLESLGWLYYRNNKPEGGAVGNALLELQSFLNPSTRNVIQMKQNNARFKKHESDAPSDT